ncbi:hypothetical protein [Providencia rettgeri]|uniref:gp53-like domain-containing protein n=1 Tax=Providencia rettgeri TaxID=587 RepID=UPI0025A7F011|nr:hypothetical protein [Providencia rettgeri]ELR5224517.1 hypothetical protein [Providencia rettgeri]MDX7324657.1 hypothetical protein [Providencia rettgeri]
MQDLMPPINTQDKIFHDGDPTTGQLGTIVTALWLNNVQAATRDVQAEIKSVLAKAGMTPDPKKTNQLADAISQIVTSGNYASTAYVDNGLNKKIDKANISGVKGNDNDKVPSLNLFTTEIGKLASIGYSYSKIESDGRYQPKGDYAPAGDYATNTALTNGLNGKLDKTGGTLRGPLKIDSSSSALSMRAIDNDPFVYLEIRNADNSRGGFLGFGSSTDPKVMSWRNDNGDTTVGTKDGSLFVNNKKALTTDDLKKNTADLSDSGFWICGETGYIQQWLLVDTKAGLGSQTFQFPTVFPNATRFVATSLKSVDGSYGGVTWSSLTRYGVTIDNVSATTKASKIYIFVGGY